MPKRFSDVCSFLPEEFARAGGRVEFLDVRSAQASGDRDPLADLREALGLPGLSVRGLALVFDPTRPTWRIRICELRDGEDLSPAIEARDEDGVLVKMSEPGTYRHAVRGEVWAIRGKYFVQTADESAWRGMKEMKRSVRHSADFEAALAHLGEGSYSVWLSAAGGRFSGASWPVAPLLTLETAAWGSYQTIIVFESDQAAASGESWVERCFEGSSSSLGSPPRIRRKGRVLIVGPTQ